MESSDRIWQLMARSLNNEISQEEQEELFQLLAQDPYLNQRYELLKRAWREEYDPSEDEDDAKAHISKIIYKAKTETGDLSFISRRGTRRRRLVPFALAFLIIIIITTGAWIFSNNRKPVSFEKETL